MAMKHLHVDDGISNLTPMERYKKMCDKMISYLTKEKLSHGNEIDSDQC